MTSGKVMLEKSPVSTIDLLKLTAIILWIIFG